MVEVVLVINDHDILMIGQLVSRTILNDFFVGEWVRFLEVVFHYNRLDFGLDFTGFTGQTQRRTSIGYPVHVIIDTIVNESRVVPSWRHVFHEAFVGDVEGVARYVQLLTDEVDAFRTDSLVDGPPRCFFGLSSSESETSASNCSPRVIGSTLQNSLHISTKYDRVSFLILGP